MKKLLAFLSSALALLFGVLFLVNRKRKDAEAALQTAEYDKEKAVTQEKLATLDREQKAALAISEVEKGRKLTEEEMLDFLKKL